MNRQQFEEAAGLTNGQIKAMLDRDVLWLDGGSKPGTGSPRTYTFNDAVRAAVLWRLSQCIGHQRAESAVRDVEKELDLTTAHAFCIVPHPGIQLWVRPSAIAKEVAGRASVDA